MGHWLAGGPGLAWPMAGQGRAVAGLEMVSCNLTGAGTDGSRGAGMGSWAMDRVRRVLGAWEGTLRLVDALKDLTDGEWNEGTKEFFLFIPCLDRLRNDALKPSSVKRVTEMKGRGQERSMQISSGAEVPEISLRQCCPCPFLSLAGI